MRRSAQVLLVLMGGGMVTAAAVPLLRGPDCGPALPPTGTCPSSSRSSTSFRSGWSSFGGSDSSRGSGSAVTTTVARGGFGATGSARAGSSGS